MSIALCGAMLLTGCGKNNEKDNGKKVKESLEEKMVKEYTLSENFSTRDNAIWYLTENDAKGKDSEVICVFVSKGGTMYRYSNDNYTLGDFANMTDEEIISMLETAKTEMEQSKAASFTESLESDIARCDTLINNLPDTIEFYDYEVSWVYSGFENVKARLQAYRDSLSALLESSAEINNTSDFMNLSYAVYTDSTGNTVVSEELQGTYNSCSYYNGDVDFLTYMETLYEKYQAYVSGNYVENDYDNSLVTALANAEFYGGYEEVNFERDDGKVEVNITGWHSVGDSEEDEIPYHVEIQENDYKIDEIKTGLSVFQVYDSYYGGYYCDDNEKCLITRTMENSVFKLDDVNSKNVMVDPKD
ncbi:MAG: hypothetical protein NC309_04740 [Ruminococcus sp.]|nr:hypothetical protein [Ruminococcus sp.]